MDRNTIRKKNRELIKQNRLWCPKCQKELDTSFFGKNNSSYYGYSHQCKACRKEHYDNPQKRRLRHVKQTYGLEPEVYKQMVGEANGICRICKQSRSLVIDHCHTSGKVRGLICNQCNSLLGMARDNASILKNAIDYLS